MAVKVIADQGWVDGRGSPEFVRRRSIVFRANGGTFRVEGAFRPVLFAGTGRETAGFVFRLHCRHPDTGAFNDLLGEVGVPVLGDDPTSFLEALAAVATEIVDG